MKSGIRENMIRHHKKSKFDPYTNEISGYLDAGMSVRNIAERLDEYFDDAVDENALYAFISSRGLKTKYSGGLGRHYEPPRCNNCEGCFEVIGLNDKPTRICYGARLIGNGVKTSPEWCHKRKKAERLS
jgi:hypothetical protein